MLQTKPLHLGNLNGAIYDFPEIGDTLPMHTHTETDVHITVVARGSFRAHGPGWERVVSAGDVLDWKPHSPHELIALETNSRFVNIVKGSPTQLSEAENNFKLEKQIEPEPEGA